VTSAGAATSDYQLFGLRVRSALDLPELWPASGPGEPDIVIEVGAIAEPQSPPGLGQADDGLLLTIPDVARFMISQGVSIRVDPEDGVDPRNVRLFLLGSAFGALLHQRRILPLHANAVDLGGFAVAFMGESGAGKSTLAAWFHDQGYRIIADDVCAVHFADDGTPLAAAGIPRLRLWEDVIHSTGRSASDYQLSYVDETEPAQKFDVPIGGDAAPPDNLPLAGIYLLDRGDTLQIDRLSQSDAAAAIIANTYRGAYVAAATVQQEHWQAAIRVAQSVPAYRLTRRWSLEQADEQYRQVLSHAATLAD